VRVSGEQTVVVLADPPWPHANGSRTNSGKSPKYPLMNLREIAALASTVGTLSGEDAVLYLWATTPHLPGAIDVLRAWGFIYRSFHVWQKSRVACGFWARSNAEILLIGEKGRPQGTTPELLMPTILAGEPLPNGHSSKPSVVHKMIERLWPHSRKVELFARDRRAGWDSFGADIGTTITSTGIVR